MKKKQTPKMHWKSKSINYVRKRYQTAWINYREVKKLDHHQPKKLKITTQSSLDHFDWETNCMFCGKTCIADEKHPERRKDVHRAEYKEYRDVVLNRCK